MQTTIGTKEKKGIEHVQNMKRGCTSRLSLFNVLATLVVITAIRSFTLTTSIAIRPDEHTHASGLSFWDQSRPSKVLPTRRLYNQTMVFSHVGKTGGETIKYRLQVTCNLRGSKRKKARCHEQFQISGESQLSRSTIGYTHCGSQRPKHSFENATAFLFSIRDPIDRIISWYQYMHPDNCFAERPSGACNLKKDSNPWGHNFYDVCFQEIDAFVQSMKASPSTDCSKLAIEAVQGNGPKAQSNHLFYNFLYNFNRTVRAFPEKDIMAIRQETLWDDMRSIEQLLGGDPTRKFEHEGPVITHGSEKFRYKANLNPALIPNLCCSIPNEILVYANIVQRALNLNNAQKQASLSALLVKCKQGSLKTLSSQCGWTNQDISASGLSKTLDIM